MVLDEHGEDNLKEVSLFKRPSLIRMISTKFWNFVVLDADLSFLAYTKFKISKTNSTHK